MRKEVRPTYDEHACAFCQRSILKGEPVDRWVEPTAAEETHVVCELCSARARREGWVPESQRDMVPRASRRNDARPGLWSRLTGRAGGADRALEADAPQPPAAPADAAAAASAAPQPAPAGAEAPDAAAPPATRREPRPAADSGAPAENGAARGARGRAGRDARAGAAGGLKDRLAGRSTRRETRHVRAVPANDAVKVERALELFNGSEHVRTIAGIARSLGEPWVMAAPIAASPSEVAVVVAWELSWYRYRIDLGDGDQPVLLLEKGEEIAQLDDALKGWNAVALPDGSLAVAAGAEAGA